MTDSFKKIEKIFFFIFLTLAVRLRRSAVEFYSCLIIETKKRAHMTQISSYRLFQTHEVSNDDINLSNNEKTSLINRIDLRQREHFSSDRFDRSEDEDEEEEKRFFLDCQLINNISVAKRMKMRKINLLFSLATCQELVLNFLSFRIGFSDRTSLKFFFETIRRNYVDVSFVVQDEFE